MVGWSVRIYGCCFHRFLPFSKRRQIRRHPVCGERGIEFADNWFNHWGIWAVLLGRIAPFIPFDVISYSAGLTQMKTRSFMIPTVVGTLPRALFYAFLGDYFNVALTKLIEYYPEVPPELEGTMFMFNIILLTIVIVMALILIVYWFVTRRYAARKETKSI